MVKKTDTDLLHEIIDTLKTDGFAIVHTAMRKAVDGDGSAEIWKLMDKMEVSSMMAINDFILACLLGFNSPLYKAASKEINETMKG